MADKQDKSKKTTNEKPISFGGLSFKEALAVLLKIAPPSKNEKKKSKKQVRQSFAGLVFKRRAALVGGVRAAWKAE